MKKRLLIIRFLVLMLMSVWIIPSWAQVSEGGLPPSFGQPTLRQSTPLFEAAINFNVNMLKAEDVRNEAEGAPIRTAIIIPSALSIERDGKWTDLANGQRIWQLEISAPNATALLLYYDEFYIPKGGKLFIYNEKRNHILGAYTEKTNARGGKFATEFVAGDKLILEYVTPAPEYTTIDKNGVVSVGKFGDVPRIKISGIAYGYNHLEVYTVMNADPSSPQLRVGESESCMININCTEGDNWQTQKRGVAKSVTPIGTGAYLCSGTILNNTAQDLNPYFLTASHCFYDTNSTVKCSNFSQVVYYFNYESLNCQTTTPIHPKTMVGAQLLVELPVIGGVAGTGGTDGALLKLLDPIPADYNVFYNGWDKRNIAPTSGVGIHHPAGDIKKISTYTTTPTETTWSGGPLNQWWNVKWAATVNGKSLTEGGSSGSPLFNQNGRVVGSLTGGPTTTGVPKCQQQVSNHVAYYGKLSYHWDGANTGTGITDQTKHMKNYLDPINSGVDVLDGTYTGVAESVAFFTADQTDLWVLGSVNYRDASTGATTWSWAFGGGTPATYSGKTPPAITYNNPGTFTTTLTINAGTANEKVKTMTITVSERGSSPVAPVAKFSLDGTSVMSENFDAALSGWTSSNQGASANAWQRGNLNNAALKFNTIDPTNVASLLFAGDQNNVADNWMKSPTYTVSSGSVLEFWALWLSNDALRSGVLSALVSTDNGANWTEVWTNGPDNIYMTREWRKININLSDYASSTFKLAFRYTGKAYDFVLLDNLKIINPGPLNTPKTIHVGETVTPIEWSAGPPTVFEWTFEGGTPATSTQQYPGAIKYMLTGTYDITLKVKSNKGENTYLFTDAVTVQDNLPVPAFSSVSDGLILQANQGAFLPPTGGNVELTDKSANIPSSWLWTLTGASPVTSTAQNVTATYPAGENSYNVTLAATNSAGTATRAETGYVKVGGKAEIWNVLYGETPNQRYLNGGYGITGADLFTLTAERFEAPATGEVTKVRIYTQNVTRGSGNMIVGIFSDNGGLPGTQISPTMTIPAASIAANGYNTITFTNPVGVSGTFHVVVGSTNYNTTCFTVPSVTQRSSTYNTVSVYYGQWWPVNNLISDKKLSMNIIPEFAYTHMDLSTPKLVKKKSVDSTPETVNMSTNATYWTATASDAWIHLSATSGTASQLPFTFTCDDNAGDFRTGCITVKAGGVTKHVVVEQMGNTPVNLIASVNSADHNIIDLVWDHNTPGILPTPLAPAPGLRSTLATEMTSTINNDAKSNLIPLPNTTPTPQIKENEWGLELMSKYNPVPSLYQAELRSTSEVKLRWDNGTNNDAIGVASGGNLEVAILFDQYDTYRYHGSKIKAVEIFPRALGSNMVLKIRSGNTIIHTQAISGLTVGAFNRIELTSPIWVNAGEDLTIGYSYTQASGSGNFVAGCDVGPAKAGKGDLISLNGDPFISLANDAGLNVNWNISVVLETSTDVTYNVYRNNTLFASGLTTKSYNDFYPTRGNTNCYKVTAVYFNNSNLETLTSNEVCVAPARTTIVEHPVGGSICKGSNHVLRVKAEGDNLRYQWFKGKNDIAGSNADTLLIANASDNDYADYYVKVTGDDGNTVISNTVSLWVADPLPSTLAFALYPNSAEIGRNYLVRLAGYSDVTKYTWSYSKPNATFEKSRDANNEIYVKFAPGAIGKGILSVDLEHVCGNRTATQEIEVRYPTGIDELESGKVKIYPNPATDVVHVTSSKSQIMNLIIMDVNGRKIYQAEPKAAEYILNVSTWSKGVYLIQTTTETGSSMSKIIKK